MSQATSLVRRPAWAWGVSLVVVGLVLWPLIGARPDDYPLSTYPMFSDRKPRTVAINYAAGLTPDRPDIQIAPSWLGTEEVLQAGVMLRQAISRGSAGARDLCGVIAGRLAADASGDEAAITTVRIVTGHYDAVSYYADDVATPERLDVHATCPVVRP